MKLRDWLPITLIGAFMLIAPPAQAESRAVLLKAPPPGEREFPACCNWCPASGCYECTAGPPKLNCGDGLIKAECTMKDDKVTCKKDDSKSVSGQSKRLKTAE